MHKEKFDIELEELRSRIDSLLTADRSMKSGEINLQQLLEEFSNSVEELQVAGEELRLQNEELARSQTIIEAQRRKYLDLFENAPDGYLVTDQAGVIRQANRAASDLLKVEQKYLTGKPLSVFIVEGDRKEFRDHLADLEQQAHAEREQTSSTTKHITSWEIGVQSRATQEALATSVSVAPFWDTDEQSIHLHWMVRDITENKRARESLFQSETRFHTIFDEADLGIVLSGLDGSILDTNPAFIQMICQSPDDLQGMNLASVLKLGTGPYPIRKLFKAFRTGTLDHFQAESQINCREKQPLWVHVIMSLVRNQEGHPVYLIVMVENITDQKQMEAELVEVERRLQDVGEEERVRLAQKLHDGPLQDLYGAMFQLKAITSAEVHDPKIREEFGNVESIMQGAINLLRSTTGDLHPPTLAHFGLEKAIRSHAENAQANHPEVAIQMELASSNESLREPVRIALFRSFQELLGNAIRHSKAKTIVVHYQTTEDELYLEIQDDGIGFQVPTHWVDLVRQGHFGLVGVAERALSVGGSVHIQSSPGKATRVWLLVPRAENEQRQKERLSVLISDIPIEGKGSRMVRTEGTL